MISDDPFHLRPIWDATFEIYEEIANVCDRHGLRYYVSDGTLIGAVRHKGFIPWDDDLDISMPRPDYDKFAEYAKSELPEHLKIVTWHNTPEFRLFCAKVMDTRREKIDAIEKRTGLKLSNGLFIDIFQIDGFPAPGLAEWIWRFKYAVISLAARRRLAHFWDLTWKGKLMWLLAAIVAPVAHRSMRTGADVMRATEDLVLSVPFETAPRCGRIWGARCIDNPVAFSFWGEPIEVPFHSGSAMIPSGYDRLLRDRHGDYMKLPPEKDRHPTHTSLEDVPWKYGPTRP